MKKAIILCNDFASRMIDRVEMVAKMHDYEIQPYCGRVFDGSINEYFSEDTAICLPIEASRNNTNPFVELRSLCSVKKVIKQNKIDSAIIYGVKNHAAMAIGARLGGAKNILCVVNGSGNLFRLGGIKGKLLRLMSFPLLRKAYKISKTICFQNPDDEELFLRKKLIKEKYRHKCFVTGGSGINLDKFCVTPLPEENNFLFLARITPSKGVFDFIKAAKIVKKAYPDAVFDIVGPLDKAVESCNETLLQEAIDAEIIRYHGVTDDVPSWMARCRYFVYPSFYPEGVPRCAMQAIASGRPIITCSTPGCKETVIDGVNGFMVLPRDPQQIAENMIWMIEHPSEVEQMATKSRELAEERFDVNKINELLIERLIK